MSASHVHAESTALPGNGAHGARRPRLTIGRTIVTALLCAALGAGGGVLYGWLRGRAPAEQREQEIAALRADAAQARKQVEDAQRGRAELARLLDLYDAYRLAQQALLSLDARNFGTAESQLRGAEHRLRVLVPAMPQLQELEQRMAGTIVTVADDLAIQRTAVGEIITQLDAEIASTRSALKLAAP